MNVRQNAFNVNILDRLTECKRFELEGKSLQKSTIGSKLNLNSNQIEWNDFFIALIGLRSAHRV